MCQEHDVRTYGQFTHEIAPDPVEAEFVRLFEHNLALKGLQNGIDGTSCRKIIAATPERHRGRILAARDKDNQVVAANVCAWGETSCFYVMTTRCDNSGNGAVSLLIWEAIKDSARRGLIFDVAGLGHAAVFSLYTGFGDRIAPRYVALRAHPLTRIAR